MTSERKPAEGEQIRFVQSGSPNQCHKGRYEGGWFYDENDMRYREQVSRWRPLESNEAERGSSCLETPTLPRAATMSSEPDLDVPADDVIMRDLRVELDELAQEILEAWSAYQAWWYFYGDETEASQRDRFQDVTEYIQIATRSHLLAMWMALSRVLDQSSETKSLPNLVRAAGKSGTLETVVLKGAKGRLKDITRFWRKAKIIRNKVFAHRSYDFERAFSEASVAPNEIRDAILLLVEVVNELLVGVGCPDYELDSEVLLDLETIFGPWGGQNAQPRE